MGVCSFDEPSTSSSHEDERQESTCRTRNIFRLLERREVTPWTKNSSRKLWRKASKSHSSSFESSHEQATDARRDLLSWVEAESFQCLLAKYCPLFPPPRSTIAAAFSPDGKTVASTHGDHTVKIIDFQSGGSLKVLSGHRRTPWVVRFHPLYPEMIASGSLDHEVRLWDANTADCIGSHDFYRPIASIAFHAQGELLAVASGHKLYIWQYNRQGETSSPTIILKTRRSLRAVHFHPRAAPFLLTAEVSDLESSDSPVTLATSTGYLHYPPPTVYLADGRCSDHLSLLDELPLVSLPFLIWPSFSRDSVRISFQHTNVSGGSSSERQRGDRSSSLQLLTYSTLTGQYELLLSPIKSNNSCPPLEETGNNLSVSEMEIEVSEPAADSSAPMELEGGTAPFFHFDDSNRWQPFWQGWLIGQTQAGQHAMHPHNELAQESTYASREIGNTAQQRFSHPHITFSSGSTEDVAHGNVMQNAVDYRHILGRFQPELAASLTQGAASELPCTVKLKIWEYDLKTPCAPLNAERCRLTIPHVVLCSEMGAHFSPCGKFLVACVACMLPRSEADLGLQSQVDQDVNGAASSPTRHPTSAHQFIYELRIYSLEEETFGSVLASRPIRAAHCLTSIQFSPTSEHLLLAYGRRHSSLLKSIVIDRESALPVYTILEIYRVSDMELVKVIPSSEDEVNVACFHPSAGEGLVYGTKEGRLRVLHHDRSHGMNNHSVSGVDDGNIFEVHTYAQEC